MSFRWKAVFGLPAGFVAGCVCANSMCLAQASASPVVIHVDADKPLGAYRPVWNYFGADEPNYTYAPNGTRLLRELSAINPAVPVSPHADHPERDGPGGLRGLPGTAEWLPQRPTLRRKLG